MKLRKFFFLFATLLSSWWLWSHLSGEKTPSQEEAKETYGVAQPPLKKAPPIKTTPRIKTKPQIQPIALKPQEPKAITATQRTPPKANKNPFALKTFYWHFEVRNRWAITQGDILIGKVLPNFKGKTGLFKPKKKLQLWPDAIIPYHIQKDLPNKNEVLAAIEYFNTQTVLRFVPFKGEPNAITFRSGTEHCYSYLGMIGGHQPIFLAPQCGFNEILHEIMHAIGFVHEHSRQDRDKHLEIHWDNIQDKYKSQFSIVPDSVIHNYTGSVFDFDHKSLMLYDANAFAKNSNEPTLKSKANEQLKPSRNQLSFIDIERIYYLYGR